ncbi:hypothetical protein OPV22_028733 [Ensete ventricosum]|uniref:Reverse transcriptase Ty1/copia-type domain-containing protein n=1 Tax=Ensete ventricosum TaxID=4639 RepID=A0AAV8Q160_ENSVE|nr:hypothetical protein OPV22_028733 [Ensete ventricosum]
MFVGFSNSKSDTYLFLRQLPDNTLYLLVYVDDIIVTSSNSLEVTMLINQLAARFSLKDLGPLTYFLGVESISTSLGLFISQRKYTHDLLVKTNMKDANAVSAPLSIGESLRLNDSSPATDSTQYRQVIGSLQYLVLTRPDISFAVNKLSQFMHRPSTTHWSAVKRVLRYLKGQAPRAWYTKLSSFLMFVGFSNSKSDTYLFLRQLPDNTLYLLVYVDDIIVTSSNSLEVTMFINQLAARFSLKDLGPLTYFLGVESISTSLGLFISQRKYTHDLLVKTNMKDANAVSAPLSIGESLRLNDGSPATDSTQYRQVIGSLQYLVLTRPDISFAVNKLSQFMHRPSTTHWSAVKRVLRYLKGTLDYGIILNKKCPLQLHAYADVDWVRNLENRTSTSGDIYWMSVKVDADWLTLFYAEESLSSLKELGVCCFWKSNDCKVGAEREREQLKTKVGGQEQFCSFAVQTKQPIDHNGVDGLEPSHMKRSAALLEALMILATVGQSSSAALSTSYCEEMGSSTYRPHTVTVTEFGAVGDGVTLNTKAFQNAIFYLHSFADKGGAQLFVPTGKWLTGSFSLISHLTISLDKDAVIIGSMDSSDWPVIDPLPSYGRGRELPGGRHQSLIHGSNLTDVIITGGNGTIYGQGSIWWDWFNNHTLNYTRPHLIELMYSTGVVISNLTFINSPFWAIHPVYCSQVLIQNVTILAPPDSPNTDGIDPDSSRRGGYVQRIHISNVVLNNVNIAIGITGQYGEHPDENFDPNALPIINMITLEDIKGTNIKHAGTLEAETGNALLS